jgi:hypothetical protein
MGAVLNAYVTAHDFMIQLDPQDIVIHRKQRNPAGSALQTVESDYGPFPVRIFIRAAGASPRIVTTLAGTQQVSVVFGMFGYGGQNLYPGKASLDAMYGPHVLDEFDDPRRGHMRIVGVSVMQMEGQVFGYECDLEVIT